MAYTELYEIAWIIEDREGNSSTMTQRLSVDGDTLTIVDLQDYATQAYPIVSAVGRGEVKKAMLSMELGRWTSGTASDESDVEEKATFILKADGTDKTVTVTYPTWSEAHVLSDSGLIDLGAPDGSDIENFLGMLINGLTVGAKLVRMMDSEKRPLTAIKAAYESFTRTRRRRR